jgi:hypothetical protein
MFGENCKGLPLENSLDRNERESMMAINPKLADCVRKQYIADYSYVGPSKSGHANVYRDINGTLYSVRVVNGEMAWPKEYPRAQETLPDPHTRFWECEYCNAVNVLSPETMKCQGCSHPITRKAMEAAWEGKWDDNTAKWATENTKMAMGVDYGYEPDKTATVLYQYSKRNNMFNAVDKMLNTGWWHR